MQRPLAQVDSAALISEATCLLDFCPEKMVPAILGDPGGANFWPRAVRTAEVLWLDKNPKPPH